MRNEFVTECLSFTGEYSAMANLLLSAMGAFAEFERALLGERQREGIALAKQRGATEVARNRWWANNLSAAPRWRGRTCLLILKCSRE